MKRVFIAFNIFFIFISLNNLSAQNQTEDPFAGNYELRNSKEIVFSGSIGGGWGGPNYFTQRVFDYLQFPGIGDSLVGGPFNIPSTDSLSVGRYNYDFYDMDAGNFFGDRSEETVDAWINENQAILLHVSGFDPFNRQWHSAFYWESDRGTFNNNEPPAYDFYDVVRVVSGNFDGDTPDEFVLAYWGACFTTLQMFLYDADSTTNFQVKATANDQLMYSNFVMTDGFMVPWFDLYAADLNQDGRDEIIVAGVEPAGSDWVVFFQIYNYDENLSAFVKQGRKIIYQSDKDSNFGDPWPRRIALTAGHYTSPEHMDCIVGVWGDGDEQNLIVVQVDSNLQDITFKRNFSQYQGETHYQWVGLFTGDLNNDGYDYLILKQTRHIYFFRLLEDLTLEQLYDLQPGNNNTYGFQTAVDRHGIVIADIDTALTLDKSTPEIILYEYIYSGNTYGLSVYNAELDSSGVILGLNLKAKKDHFEGDGFYANSMVAANLDMDDIHLGTPKRYQKTDIVQPIVVLNAPPIHYDILDGIPYDIDYAFNENECQFYSTYQKQSETSVEISTEVLKSWTTSTTLSGSFSPFNIFIGASLTKSYGQNFSKVTGSSHTVTIQVAADATVDDRIYATLVDYNLLEYPAFAGETPIGHILVLEPTAVRNQWFPSKSPVATSYVPNHEVGNIFSYKDYPELFNNEEVASLIKGSYGQSFTLDENSSYDWSLTFNDFSTSGTSISSTVNREIGASVGIFGISAGVSDSYSKSNTQTHKISVTQNLSLKVYLDKIDRTIGEVYYTVTPYAYWAKNGALVIDYAVKPELAEPGYPLTWWQTNYDGYPDPAFILPWRYDQEKGFETAVDKIYQTKEILFTPAEPIPEEVVTISARIQNYSLLATPAPVKVRFYIGNPDSGGTVITGIDGNTDVYTADIIQPRSYAYVYQDWKIPTDLEQFPRIYAVIDPDNELTEIHEDNNMGFSVLGQYSIPTNIASPEETVPTRFELEQNYPNPFNSVTSIKYQLSKPSPVNLSIYNALGQRISVLVAEKQQTGLHRITWDASGLPSGIYFYRLVAGQSIFTRKMLYLK